MTRQTLSLVAAGLLTLASAVVTTHANAGDATHSPAASTSNTTSACRCGNYDYYQTYTGFATDDDATDEGNWHLQNDANANSFTTHEESDGTWTLVVWYRI